MMPELASTTHTLWRLLSQTASNLSGASQWFLQLSSDESCDGTDCGSSRRVTAVLAQLLQLDDLVLRRSCTQKRRNWAIECMQKTSKKPWQRLFGNVFRALVRQPQLHSRMQLQRYSLQQSRDVIRSAAISLGLVDVKQPRDFTCQSTDMTRMN